MPTSSTVAVPTGFLGSTKQGHQARCDKPTFVQYSHAKVPSKPKLLCQRLGHKDFSHTEKFQKLGKKSQTPHVKLFYFLKD